MNHMILIKYGELTTKKANRKVFINMLSRNIENLLKDYPIKITKDRVRMYIEVEEMYLNDVVSLLETMYMKYH